MDNDLFDKPYLAVHLDDADKARKTASDKGLALLAHPYIPQGQAYEVHPERMIPLDFSISFTMNIEDPYLYRRLLYGRRTMYGRMRW